MPRVIFAGLFACLMAACGGGGRTYDDTDDDHYTQEDLEAETSDVYRPRNNGSDKPARNSDPKPAEPKEQPGPVVVKPEQPKEEPKEEPKPEPKPEPKKEPGPKVGKPEPQPKETPAKVEPKPDRGPKIKSFMADVRARKDAMKSDKLWKDFLKAKETFDERVDKALEKARDDKGKDAEQAWASAITAWYEVRYMYHLWMHMNWKAAVEFAADVRFNEQELTAYSDSELASADCARTKAAFELAEDEMVEVRQFQTDVLKYDLVASKVYVDAKQAKKWEKEKKKWQDATEGKFDDKDMKKYQ